MLCRIPFWPRSYSAIQTACAQGCSLSWCWVSFLCWQDTNLFVNQTSNFKLHYYRIDKLVTIKASTSINFLQLKSDKTELFMACSCHQPKPILTSNPSLKFSPGSLVKSLMCFLIASSSFSIAVKRLRLAIISWNKCALLIVFMFRRLDYFNAQLVDLLMRLIIKFHLV